MERGILFKLEDVIATLNSKELQKMTEAKGDGGEWLYVRGRSEQFEDGFSQVYSQRILKVLSGMKISFPVSGSMMVGMDNCSCC
ncbi:hypothetical protein Tco_1106960 [Tanacetum coccineum]